MGAVGVIGVYVCAKSDDDPASLSLVPMWDESDVNAYWERVEKKRSDMGLEKVPRYLLNTTPL